MAWVKKMGFEMKGRQKSPRGSSFKLMLTVEQKARRKMTSLLRLVMVKGNEEEEQLIKAKRKVKERVRLKLSKMQ